MFNVFKKLVLAVADKFGVRTAVEELIAIGVDPVEIATWVVKYRDNLAVVLQKLIDTYKELYPKEMKSSGKCDPEVAKLLCHQRCHLACMVLDTLELCHLLGCCPDEMPHDDDDCLTK